MTTDEPPRLNRRATDRDPRLTPQAKRRRLVSFMAADPDNVAWLASHNAMLLERVARHLSLRGDHSAAARVREIAQAHRDSSVSPF